MHPVSELHPAQQAVQHDALLTYPHSTRWCVGITIHRVLVERDSTFLTHSLKESTWGRREGEGGRGGESRGAGQERC